MIKKIELLLFSVLGVVNFNKKNYIEVQPGVMTSLVINIKRTLNDFKVRSRIARELAKAANPNSICICGIESGGSYYASAVADLMKKPLVLFRKKSKDYGLGKRFVGTIPEERGGLVTVIDDVIGEGKISTANAEELINLGYRIEICAIFSYLPQMKEFMSKIKIVSLSDINKLCEVGRELKRFTEEGIALIKKECRYSSRQQFNK